jgi:hypothetical protein
MNKRGALGLSMVFLLAGFGALVFPAASAERDSELFWSKPSDLPAWAQPGTFRFIRLDGGGIETSKAERTWWGMMFTDAQKDTLSHIYDRDFEKMLGLLKQAEFNWIWVTWSNGWSFEREAENRENLKKVISRCHANGIRVTAYMSATNMFWFSAFRDDPETRQWVYRVAGLPQLYGGSPHRILADPSKPEWRAYLLKKAQLALEAGADAIFYDNLFGDDYAIMLLVSETQSLAEAEAKKSGRAKALVYANTHMTPSGFEIDDHCDVLWDESGKGTPGIWETGWHTENIRKLKYYYAARQPWQPAMYENDRYHCGPRETCIPTPAEQKLGIAEAYAFGAALSRNLEGRFLEGLIRGDRTALEAWAAISEYNRFVKDQAWFYNQATPIARIAVLSKTQTNPFADALLQQGVIFQTKVLERMEQGVPLNQFKALVVPVAMGKLSPEQDKMFSDFVSGGGKIFAARPDEFPKSIRASIVPIPHSIGIRVLGGYSIAKWAGAVESAAGGPLIRIENGKYVLAQVTRKAGANTFIIHLLNYDLKNPAQNVKVTVNLSDYVQDLSGFQLELISPDQEVTARPSINFSGGQAEFAVSSIKYYSIAAIYFSVPGGGLQR